MEIKTIEIAGLAGALTALRLPFGKEVRSDIQVQIGSNECPQPDANKEWGTSCYINIDPKDISLMQTLIKRGDEHAKVLRGIIAWAKITTPIYVARELETYRAGRERLSCESTMHIDARGLSGAELQKVKAEIPMGHPCTFVDSFSYQCLRNIIRQRHNHRLPEWHTFVDWVRTLPLADELILVGLELD